ncbi:MAG TPA: DegT/DnrJ/EryC1/StrS family aminotransferase [Syntrophales bacterium]|nr:DegT/DnrJ/EryC1/StrS family aminotransferase [Syntrophales bacterium]HOX93966.1 DegT/DnrJ/EryC1/StrS family aminotransferase [Syntrophales bacterium]HPI57407.1 DegT/DnrJ/EryC1/StrS family aminotransferase [Syntrophales bacterium]HPN25471.1 DegT/DnrJ/EryC1/StrS family aminotransferase [Syntrophales bacterium]HQM29953.1 DegT/DnrJ/EryC1/StrS family aminotransferase [Syntrophales bacterium]
MNIPLVDLKSQYQSIQPEIDSVIAEVISKTAFIGGAHVNSFEKAFADFCNVKHCVGVGNGTDALFIALRILGIGAGDEVLVPANSFIATSEAVTLTGARVAFVDVNPITYNMNPDRLEDYLKKRASSRLKAVIPVHLYGQPADMDPLLGLADRYGLKVIEDAAQAHGADYKGRRIGSIGHVACFSFYPGKNLGAYGDGGAIVTNDDDFATRARMFANHGRVDKYDHQVEGVNSRLDGLQAAILDVKLKHLLEWTEMRRKNAYLYNRCLRDTGLITPAEMDGVKAVYHLYVVRTKKELRAKLQKYLETRGIATGIHYPIALPNLRAYAYLKHRGEDFPEATKASQEIFSLPMYPELTEAQISHISKAIGDFFTGSRK